MKNNNQNWEEELLRLVGEFQKSWSTHTDWSKYGEPAFLKIKQFIRNLLKEERKRILEKFVSEYSSVR